MASRKQFGSFSFGPDAASKMARNATKYVDKLDKDLNTRMNIAVNAVWAIAHQRRPQISSEQAKAEGRGYKTVINSKGKATKKLNRVSDPNAAAGVPVDTGNLQIHVKKEIIPGKLGKIIGRIYVEDVEYALAMEFGSPAKNVAARPFMRPAIDLSRPLLKNVFSKKLDA